MSLSIEETIDDLRNCDKPLLNSTLADLSNLNPEEAEFLEQAWAAIELERRREILFRLVELAEENVELDFDGIFKSCLKDQDGEIRSKAIEGLWESEEASLIRPLINLLEQDSSEKVQTAAATGLGKFTMLVELKKLNSSHKPQLCQTLLAVLDDENRSIEVRRRTLEAVAPLNLPAVKEAIMKAYQSHNPKIKTSAIYAMGKNCHRSWLSILIEELSSANTEIRYEAAGACGELGEEEAAPPLMKLINDPDTDVQLAAIQALGKIGGTEVKGCLEQCLNNPNELIQDAAEEALLELETREDPFSFRISRGLYDIRPED